MTDGSDNGEDDFTDGQQASDVEADTERDNAAVQTTATEKQNLQFTSSTIGPATGVMVHRVFSGGSWLFDARAEVTGSDETPWDDAVRASSLAKCTNQ